MITTLLLDVDNTLLDFEKCAEFSVRKGFEANSIPFSDEVMKTFHSINDGLWQKIEQGSLTRERLHEIRWQLVFEALGVNKNGVEFEKEFVGNLRDSHETVDGAYDFLDYLAPKYDLNVVSNGPYEQQCHRLECADMAKYFSHIFVSEEIGISKPDKRFFDECRKRLGNIPKEEMLLIGDSPSADIQGGINFGIKTCWFNFARSNEQVDADYTIDRLCEIKNLL